MWADLEIAVGLSALFCQLCLMTLWPTSYSGLDPAFWCSPKWWEQLSPPLSPILSCGCLSFLQLEGGEDTLKHCLCCSQNPMSLKWAFLPRVSHRKDGFHNQPGFPAAGTQVSQTFIPSPPCLRAPTSSSVERWGTYSLTGWLTQMKWTEIGKEHVVSEVIDWAHLQAT